MGFASIEEILDDLKTGRMIILVDDERRENEGDLTMAAEKVTPEAINFMITHGRGLLCLALNPERGAAYLARGLAHNALQHRGEAEKDIHDSHALNSVELSEFLEEYILSDPLFNRTLLLFEKDEGKWRLSLTEDEVQRLAILH